MFDNVHCLGSYRSLFFLRVYKLTYTVEMIVLDNTPTETARLPWPRLSAATCTNDILKALPRDKEFAADTSVTERQIRDAAKMLDNAMANCQGETSVSERARTAREVLCQILPGRVYGPGDPLYQSGITFNWWVPEASRAAVRHWLTTTAQQVADMLVAVCLLRSA